MLEKVTSDLPNSMNRNEATDDKRQPKIIRGHHLFALLDAIGVAGPKIAARRHTAVILGDEPAWVIRDMIAPDDTEGRKFTASLTSALQHFVSLPDDYPVHIVSGQQDFICAICAVGSHCNKLRQDNGQGDAVFYDEIYLDRFINTADSLGVSLKIVKSKKFFDDTENTREITTIKTNKATLIKILDITDFT